MTFLHPWALAGLVAAAVPIILHLVQRREPPTVMFPAVRYLIDATREHQRRLRVQHWLLLAIRTLLIVALVLAAAGPLIARPGVASHAPSAMVVVLDNSASSAAIAGGTRRLDQLARAADGALARATPNDALWLLTADGIPRRGDAATLRGMVKQVVPSARRLDLGEAVTTADRVLSGATTEPFRFGFAIQCISLGRNDGIVDFVNADDVPRNRSITGRAAAWIKEMICRYTVMSVRLESRGLHYGWPKAELASGL